MEMIKIPHAGLEVSRLALGCKGLGGGWEANVQLTKDHERQAREFLDTAEEIGFPWHSLDGTVAVMETIDDACRQVAAQAGGASPGQSPRRRLPKLIIRPAKVARITT